MIIEQKINTVLSSVFNGELYPVRHPDPDGTESEVAKTFAVYIKIGGRSLQNLKGDTDLSKPRIQVSIYSIDYDELKEKEQAVNDAMKAANDTFLALKETGEDFGEVANAIPNFSSSVPTDGFEADTKRYYLHMEFYCWQRN